MRVVADTNTVISALFWSGAPRHLLDAARAGSIQLFTSAELLAELEEVLQRERFAQRLPVVDLSAKDLVLGYAALAALVEPAPFAPFVLDDPDDDAVLACAVAARANAIVSGDSHLLRLDAFEEIPILTAPQLLHALPSTD
jgi:uncharacterized protein